MTRLLAHSDAAEQLDNILLHGLYEPCETDVDCDAVDAAGRPVLL